MQEAALIGVIFHTPPDVILDTTPARFMIRRAGAEFLIDELPGLLGLSGG